MGRNQGGWIDIQGIGGEHQIGFMIGQKFQHRRQHWPISQIIAQHVRRQAGQRQQPLSPGWIAQHPRQRG